MFELIGRAHAQSWRFPEFDFVSGDLMDIISRLVTWVLIFAGALAVIYLVYGGIMYITAGGDAEKATKGRTALINAIIGIVIILLAIVIVNFVMNIVQNNAR